MYCLRCREPIVPQNNRVTIHETGTSLKLSGICPLCGKVANRAYKISAKDLLSDAFHIVDDLSISDSATSLRLPHSGKPHTTTSDTRKRRTIMSSVIKQKSLAPLPPRNDRKGHNFTHSQKNMRRYFMHISSDCQTKGA